MLFLDDGFHFFLDYNPHSLVEDALESLLGEGAALHVFALELFFDDFAGGFLHDRSFLGVLLVHGELLPQVDFVTYEDLGDVADVFLELGVPLGRGICTFLRALTKEEG